MSRIRTVCSESSQGTMWVVMDPKRLQTDSEGTEETVLMRRLIWDFAGL